jgi:hypothetical protein
MPRPQNQPSCVDVSSEWIEMYVPVISHAHHPCRCEGYVAADKLKNIRMSIYRRFLECVGYPSQKRYGGPIVPSTDACWTLLTIVLLLGQSPQ